VPTLLTMILYLFRQSRAP